MSTLLGRLATRLGATAMVAAAGLAVTAVPASAAPGVDLAVTVKSGVVAAGSDAKPFAVKVTNLGDAKAEGFIFTLDLEKVDTKKVAVELEDADQCLTEGTKITCALKNVLVRNDSLDFLVFVTPQDGALGPAGSFAASVTSDADTNKGNNSTTVTVGVTKPGVDIVVFAEDVVADRDAETNEAKRIAPGGTGELYFEVINFGSATTDGVEFTLQLPEHTSFTEDLDGCTTSNGARKITCTLTGYQLLPYHFLSATVAVKVASSAPQAVELKGSLEGKALGVFEGDVSAARRSAPAEAPSWLTNSGDANPNEVDNKDNTDEFVVFVGGSAGGGLPVTGPKAIAIGGAGAAVLAVGVFLFVAARRRRVVLVTPAE